MKHFQTNETGIPRLRCNRILKEIIALSQNAIQNTNHVFIDSRLYLVTFKRNTTNTKKKKKKT